MTMDVQSIAATDKPAPRAARLTPGQAFELEDHINRIDAHKQALRNARAIQSPRQIDAKLAELDRERQDICQRLADDRAQRPRSITERVTDQLLDSL